MVRKLTKMGDDYGLVIDKAVLELLNIDPNDELEISTDGAQLVIKVALKPETKGPKVKRGPGIPDRREKDMPAERDHRYGFPKKQPW